MEDNSNSAFIAKLRRAAVWGLAAVFAALAVRGVIEYDKTEIEQSNSMPDSSSVIEHQPIDDIDLNAVLASRTEAYLTPEQSDDLLLAKNYDAPRSRLQPVYNAVFSDDGFQVASLADTKLLCAAEAVYPLSHMLTDFYSETGMRTVMVSSAYQAPPEPQYNYGMTPEEQSAPDEASTGLLIGFSLYEENKGSRAFTGAGIYDWFVDNCYKYGFVLRYPKGKEEVTGHDADMTLFRFVGEEAAAFMHENGYCFDELELGLMKMNFDAPMLVDAYGRNELVYAVQADMNGNVQIELPADPEGNAAPFKAYRCGSGYLICAQLQYIPLLENASTDADSAEQTSE